MRSLPEHLNRLSEQASKAFLGGSSKSLTESVRSTIDGMGLNREQVARVTQMANRLTWLGSEDKTVRFDPASPTEVLGDTTPTEPTQFHAELPPGPAPSLERAERIPLYSGVQEAPLGDPVAEAEELTGQAKVASYEAHADLSNAREKFASAVSAFDGAVLDALWTNAETPRTLVAALAKVEKNPTLTDVLLKQALEGAIAHGVEVRDTHETLPEDFGVDTSHPVAAAFLEVVEQAERVKVARDRIFMCNTLGQGAEDVVKRIAARSR